MINNKLMEIPSYPLPHNNDKASDRVAGTFRTGRETLGKCNKHPEEGDKRAEMSASWPSR